MSYKKNVRRDFISRWIGSNSVQRGFYNHSFDAPTYLTFKIEFGLWVGQSILPDTSFTIPHRGNNSRVGDYDRMPTPFFQLATQTENFQRTSDLGFESGTISNDININPSMAIPTGVYSTYYWLLNSNQGTRAEMLLDFIAGIQEIQDNYQYLFQSISGLNTLLDISPSRGMRVKDGKISIKCLDSIDQKIRHLLSLYRRIVWDDTYQRWAVPDMMRFFKMFIYISEIRTFQEPTELSKINSDSNKDNISQKDASLGTSSLILKTINNISPVTMIECDMCDIDIASISKIHSDSFDINNGEASAFSFVVNVRNVNVVEHYTALLDRMMTKTKGMQSYKRTPFAEKYSLALGQYDKKLSSFLDDEIVNQWVRNLGTSNSKHIISRYEEIIGNSDFFTDVVRLTEADKVHTSGKFYINKDENAPEQLSGNRNYLTELLANGIKWVEGAITNFIKDKITQLQYEPLFGTNITANDIINGIGTKNPVHLFGLIKGALDKDFNRNFGYDEVANKVFFQQLLGDISRVEPKNNLEKNLVVSAKDIIFDVEKMQKVLNFDNTDIREVLREFEIFTSNVEHNIDASANLIGDKPNDVELTDGLVGLQINEMDIDKGFRLLGFSANEMSDITTDLIGESPKELNIQHHIKGESPNEVDTSSHRLIGTTPNDLELSADLVGDYISFDIGDIEMVGETIQPILENTEFVDSGTTFKSSSLSKFTLLGDYKRDNVGNVIKDITMTSSDNGVSIGVQSDVQMRSNVPNEINRLESGLINTSKTSLVVDDKARLKGQEVINRLDDIEMVNGVSKDVLVDKNVGNKSNNPNISNPSTHISMYSHSSGNIDLENGEILLTSQASEFSGLKDPQLYSDERSSVNVSEKRLEVDAEQVRRLQERYKIKSNKQK